VSAPLGDPGWLRPRSGRRTPPPAASRCARRPTDAADELRRLESDGALEPRASRAVLVAAGHGEPQTRTGKRQQNPGGLTRR